MPIAQEFSQYRYCKLDVEQLTNFLNACLLQILSCSPLDKGGWGGQSVESEKEISITPQPFLHHQPLPQD